MTHNSTYYYPCNVSTNGQTNLTACTMAHDTEWPLERIVSTVVPVFFGITALTGLLGNALVIIGNLIFFYFLFSISPFGMYLTNQMFI